MEKIKKRIANLKVAGKLKVYRMTVLVMTLFLVLVALISTLVIRSNIEKITEVWSPSLEYLQDLETMTAKYRIKQYQHLVESDASDMTACEEEIRKLESQIQDTDANLDAIMSADSDAKKGQNDYEVANAAWEKYRAASDEILKLSRENKQQEAARLMIGEGYEEYKAFAEKLTILRDEFQVELDRAKTMANVCTIIIFVVIVAAGLAIAVVTTLIGKIITDSITEPVEQIDAAVASLRKGELSNVEMLTYESEDELGDTIKNLKEAMGILADYVREGTCLSGGEKQRLALARLWFEDSELVILDEATSAMDNLTEENVMKSVMQKMKDKTVIAIAHRLNSIAGFDRIILFKEGRIVGQGTFEELLHTDSYFMDLYNANVK